MLGTLGRTFSLGSRSSGILKSIGSWLSSNILPTIKTFGKAVVQTFVDKAIQSATEQMQEAGMGVKKFMASYVSQPYQKEASEQWVPMDDEMNRLKRRAKNKLKEEFNKPKRLKSELKTPIPPTTRTEFNEPILYEKGF